MELTAVIEALARAEAPEPRRGLHTDSQYVQKGITEWIHGWKARGWRTAAKEPVKNVDLWKRLDEVARSARHRLDLGEGPRRATKATSAPTRWPTRAWRRLA